MTVNFTLYFRLNFLGFSAAIAVKFFLMRD
jgi:hypothetical protein